MIVGVHRRADWRVTRARTNPAAAVVVVVAIIGCLRRVASVFVSQRELNKRVVMLIHHHT